MPCRRRVWTAASRAPATRPAISRWKRAAPPTGATWRWRRDPRRSPPGHPRDRHGDDARRHRDRHAGRCGGRGLAMAGGASTRRDAPAVDRTLPRGTEHPPFAPDRHRRGDRTGCVHRVTRRHRDRQGDRPRPGHPARRRLHGGGLHRRGRDRSRDLRGTDRPARSCRAVGPDRGPARSRSSAAARRVGVVTRRGRRPRRDRSCRARPGRCRRARRDRPIRPRDGPRSGGRNAAAGALERARDARPRIRHPASRRSTRDRDRGMVARPPLKVVIEPMAVDDLAEVQAIEKASFSSPWPPHAYRSELESNRLAQYLVARVDDEVAGYGGMWLMVDEAHITTFAVHPSWRRQRIGERLLLAFLDLAVDRRAREATLEVRLSNLPARRLYEKYGFRPVGLRPRYYSDDNEDALIMTTDGLRDQPMHDRIARLREALDEAPAPRRVSPKGSIATG